MKCRIIFTKPSDITSKVWLTGNDSGIVAIDGTGYDSVLVVNTATESLLLIYNRLCFWATSDKAAKSILWAIVEVLP